jgi:hypothetical protein
VLNMRWHVYRSEVQSPLHSTIGESDTVLHSEATKSHKYLSACYHSNSFVLKYLVPGAGSAADHCM